VIGLKWIPIRIRTGNTDPEAIKVIKLAKIGSFKYLSLLLIPNVEELGSSQ